MRTCLIYSPIMIITAAGLSTATSNEGVTGIIEQDQLIKSLTVLSELPTGKDLIARSIQAWNLRDRAEMLNHFQWGDVSRTDTVLTRHFNPQSGEELKDREVKIYLKKQQPWIEIFLDMAHEIVHATARPNFDPYDPELTAGRYILNAIEGEGGEVDAVLAECEVGLELSGRLGVPISRCESYDISRKIDRLKKVNLDRSAVIKDFYRVGNWLPELMHRLASETSFFPHFSENAPQLYSSTGHAPYPVALLREFDELTQVACKNTRNRIQSSEASSTTLIQWSKKVPEEQLFSKNKVVAFIKKRCDRKNEQNDRFD